ncbi:sensor histidine kinase [Brevundimonas sp. TWP1-2-1b1]|uniref:sensor histidine kinase n=1 Tax=unclassified Brevundimonas TaxID=2622653 RepID=UPI003CF80252
MAEHLRFSPDILARLGEELVPDVDQGILELVKNAYDADATECTIALTDLASGQGLIVVRDTGVGMTQETLRQGWLVLGRSGKKTKETTLRYGRVPVGDKGLGRLAALRLGRRVTLKTRPIGEPGKQYELTLDWDQFDTADVIEDVAIDVRAIETTEPAGTDIFIEAIKSPITRTTVNKLARNLLLLADPFPNEGGVAGPVLTVDSPRAERVADPGFKPELLTEDYADLQNKVSQSYFADAEYRIQAVLDDVGRAEFRIIDWKGETLHQTFGEGNYGAPPFVFDLWVFILNGGTFSNRSATVSEVRDWLQHVGGVHVYEDAIRVPPYGGPGDDWLGLNLRRVRSPEMRPSTNTSIGRVRVSNLDRRLAQKTDRIGYIESQSFQEMQRCCGDALDWAARVRIKERDQKQQAEKQANQQKTERASTRLEAVLTKTVPLTDRKQVEDAIQQYVKESGQEAKSLRDELQLYRSLATAGMTSAVFSHEIGRPLSLIDDGLKALRKLIPADKQANADKRIDRIAEAKVRLNSFVSIPLNLLAKRKRRSGRVTVNRVVTDLVTLIEPIMSYYNVGLDLDLTDHYTDINGSEALIDGICLNFIMNSISAFHREGYVQADRRIRVATGYDGSSVLLTVADNGGGIDGLDIEDIWAPGVTTDPEGTGFGLTIVRDSVTDLGGSVRVEPITDFGGAEFVVSLPPMRQLFG